MSKKTESGIQFRLAAWLSHFQGDTAESIVRITHPYSWPLLYTSGICAIVVLLWGVFGRVPLWVQGDGLLLSIDDRVHSVVTPDGPSIVRKFVVSPGQHVQANDTIAILDKPDLNAQMRMTQHQLTALRQIYEKLKTTAFQEIAERKNQTNALNDKLVKMIDEQGDFQKFSEKVLKSKMDLFRKKILANNEILNHQQNFLSSRRQVEDLRTQIINNDVALNSVRDNWSDRLRTLEVQILQLEQQNNTEKKRLELLHEIKTPVAGIVGFLHKNVGDSVPVGEPIATITKSNDDLEAILFLPVKDGKMVRVGQRTLISPSLYKKEEYGSIEGDIIMVSEFPVVPQDMMATFQNESLVKSFIEKGPHYKVKVDLKRDENTVSHYRWSSSKGPHGKLTQGTMVNAQVMVEERRPISLVIPALKSIWGG